ncbi:MAG: hypothetical protein EXS10_04535 [Phycisphaerales bacterium]|nr:hypothetical protein [Phycisphaerales bacterium]
MSRFDRTTHRSGLAATEPKSMLRQDPQEASAIDPVKAQLMLAEAKAVLAELQAGRQIVETKLEEERRIDAMKGIRGVSSMDEAIQATQALIALLERGVSDAERSTRA